MQPSFADVNSVLECELGGEALHEEEALIYHVMQPAEHSYRSACNLGGWSETGQDLGAGVNEIVSEGNMI